MNQMTTVAARDGLSFVSSVGRPSAVTPKAWRPLMVSGAAIADEVQRLAQTPAEPGMHRSSLIVHPEASEPGLGITPGLAITINVVMPGESTTYFRDNANRFEFAIQGEGAAQIGEQRLRLEKWSGWNVPSMRRREYRNDSAEPLVWLSYANTPLLEKLGVYFSDGLASKPRMRSEGTRYAREGAPDFPILSDGARARGYEYLVDIEVVENKALLWPYQEVARHLSQEAGDQKRTILLLYNPATGRRNGTTHSFFATLSSFPPGAARPAPARGHKHSSFACNYHFRGAGLSVVDGETVEWRAGDLLLSAPSWSEHAHGSSAEGSTVLTVQDHPFQIGIESLIWQETMDGPILTLGSEPGVTGYVGPRLAGA